MKVVVFLLRGAGWAAFGIFVGFVVSYFFRFSGRVDVFALTETMLGVVITGLAIVGAFVVAIQWSNIDSRIQAFNTEVENARFALFNTIKDIDKKTREIINEQNKNIDKFGNFLSEIKKEAADAKISYKNIMDLIKEMKKQHEQIDSITENAERLLNNLQEEKIGLDSEQNVNTKILDGTIKSEPTVKQNGLAEGEEG
jgi:hypothetical protein